MKHRKKVCTHCGRKLWLREFYVSKRGWTASWCKDCTKANKRDWYARTRKVPDGLRHDSETGRITEQGPVKGAVGRPAMLYGFTGKNVRPHS